MLLVSRELTVEVVRDPSVVLAAEPAVGFVAVDAELGVTAAEVTDAQVLDLVRGFAVVGNDDAFAALGLDDLVGLDLGDDHLLEVGVDPYVADQECSHAPDRSGGYKTEADGVSCTLARTVAVVVVVLLSEVGSHQPEQRAAEHQDKVVSH